MVKKRRKAPNAADILLASIAPVLISGMILGLVYFLVSIFYRGEYSTRILYVLTLYTGAAVLTARISIEQNRTLGLGYLAALGLAAFIVTSRFVVIRGPGTELASIINIALLGLIAYLADRITFDCTFVDERAKSSGEGLLQSLGWVHSTRHVRQEATTDREQIEAVTSASKAGHNPGVWILYFAVIALPIYGFGQVFIPSYDTAARSAAFASLVVYLFCSLALLVLVSLLGVRRYLRQRNIEMSNSMTTQWLSIGIAAIIGLLAFGLILPLSSQSIFQMSPPITFSSPDDMKSSRLGWGKEGVKDDAGQSSGPAKDDVDAQSSDASGAKNEGGASGDKKSGKAGENSQGGGDDQSPQTEGEQAKANSAKSPPSQASKDGQKSEDSSNQSPQQDGGESGQNEQSQQAKKQPVGQPDQSSDQQASRDESESKQGDQQSLEDRGESTEQDANDPSQAEKNESKESNGQRNQQQQRQASPPPPPTPQSSFQTNWLSVLKLLIVIGLACLVVFYALTHRAEVTRLWEDFRNFLAALFGGRRSPAQVVKQELAAADPPRIRHRSFRDFSNPFSNGPVKSVREATRITFHALEAWAREHAVERQEGETPTEFVSRVSSALRLRNTELSRFADAYNKSAYSSQSLNAQHLDDMERLWVFMQSQ